MYITTTQLQLFYEIEYIGSTLKINEQFKKIILLFRLLFSLSDSMIQKRSCVFSAQSSLSIFTQKYLCKCRDIYLMLQNKYLCIYKDSFGAKILKDDCALRTWIHKSSDRFSPPLHL